MKTKKRNLMAAALGTAFITVAVGGIAQAQATIDLSLGGDCGGTGFIYNMPLVNYPDSVTNSGLSWEFTPDLQNFVVPAGQLTGLGSDGNPINYEDLLPIKVTQLSIMAGAPGAAPTGTGTIIDSDGIATNALSILDTTTSTQVAITVANGTLSVGGSPISTDFGSLTNVPTDLADGDNQTLSLSTNSLSISGGNSVSLATVVPAAVPFANLTGVPTGLADGDNDGQTLSLATGVLSLTNGGSADLKTVIPNAMPFANLTSVPTGLADGDNQALSLATGVLSLTNGGSADLKTVVPNAIPFANLTGVPTGIADGDNQTLALANGILTLTNGGSVDINKNLDYLFCDGGVQGTFADAQGIWIDWNNTAVVGSASSGMTNLVNNRGLGPGGFTFSNTDNGTTFTRLATMDSAGNFTSTGKIKASSALHVDGNAGITNDSGSYITWNHTTLSGAASTGRTNFLNHRGGGMGGFTFNMTNDGSTFSTLGVIDGSGNFTATGNITAGGNITGDLITASAGINTNIVTASSIKVNSSTGLGDAQGAWTVWNHGASTAAGMNGATSFINQKGLGNGGFTFSNTGDAVTFTKLLSINSAGNGVFLGSCTATSHPVSSDARLKSNVEEFDNGLETVEALNPVSYTKVAKIGDDPSTGTPEIGLIAQEVQKVLPVVVKTADDEHKTLSVNYDSLVPVLISAVQEQQKEIEVLKDEVSALKKNKK